MPKSDSDLLSLSEQDLDLLLGEALTADEFGAKKLTDADKRRQARNWFSSSIGELQDAVCKSPSVQRYVQQKDGVERELFDAIVAALASVMGIPVPVSVLAAKIVRFGTANLCGIDTNPVKRG